MRITLIIKGAHVGPPPDCTRHSWSVQGTVGLHWALLAWVPRTVYLGRPWKLRAYDGGIGPLRWSFA